LIPAAAVRQTLASALPWLVRKFGRRPGLTAPAARSIRD